MSLVHDSRRQDILSCAAAIFGLSGAEAAALGNNIDLQAALQGFKGVSDSAIRHYANCNCCWRLCSAAPIAVPLP